MCIAFAGALLTPAAEGASETLARVRSNHVLRCGIGENLAGFSEKDASGRYRGFNVDFCRAVAAAVLGDPTKVAYTPVNAAARFPLLLSGQVDLLSHTATWTLAREGGIGLSFPGIYFYDSQAFMVPRAGGARRLEDLKGATICAVKGTTHVAHLEDAFATRKIAYVPLVLDSQVAATAAFFEGRCQALTSDQSTLWAMRVRAPGGAERYDILPELISREPLAPVVRRADEQWITIVRWVLNTLVIAEQQGLTAATARRTLENPSDPVVRRSVDELRSVARALGLAEDWYLRVIEASGNYGEIFDRNLGAGQPAAHGARTEPPLDRRRASVRPADTLNMTEFQTIFTLVVFAAVILAIAFDVVDMVLAALLGVAALIVVGVFSSQDVIKVTTNSGGPLALLFGGMIVAGVLAPTGLFDWVGTRYLHFTRGSGRRFLIGLVILVGTLCAFLPNATTVVLLAPVIIRVARELDIDIVPPMILTAIVSNTAGLLTLVGDPATFLVGSSIGMSFGEYLQKVSLGGLLTLLALTAMLPWLMRDIWNLQRELPAAAADGRHHAALLRHRGAARARGDGPALPLRGRHPDGDRSAGSSHRRGRARVARRAGGEGGGRRRPVEAGRLEDVAFPRCCCSLWSRPSTRPAFCRASRTNCTRSSARRR